MIRIVIHFTRKSEKLVSEKAVAENMYLQQTGETVKMAKALTKEREEKRKLSTENKSLRDNMEQQKLRYEKELEAQRISLKFAQNKIEDLQRALSEHSQMRQNCEMPTGQKGDMTANKPQKIPIEAVECQMHYPKPRRCSSRNLEQQQQQHIVMPQQRGGSKKRRSSELNMTETLSVMFGMPISNGTY